MRAIIMAAGVGSRISRYIDKPKCLLSIDGKSILRRTVEKFLERDIKVAVVVGFQHRQIEEDLKGLDVVIFYNPFYRVTNSLGSLWFAKEFIPDDEIFLLMNADVYLEEEILDILLREDKDAVLLADSTRNRLDEGDYFFGCENNKIVKYGKELAREIRTHEYVGICKVRPAFMFEFKSMMRRMIDDEQYDCWWEDILYRCSSKLDVYVRDIAGHFWAEVDYIEDYERIMQHILGKGKLT